MKATELRASILQEAVSGKLVPQIASEGTADELLKQIEAERAALIKDGKIKKEKPLPEITDDEIPFEIPKSWKWVHIGDLFQHNNGKQLNGTEGDGKLLTYITTSNLYWDHFNLGNLGKMPFTDDEIDKCTAVKGDLLVCEGGDFGRAAIWDRDEPIRLQNHIHKLRPYGKLSVKFYYYIFYFYKLTDKIKGRGIGIQGLSARVLHNIVVPLPPLSEQKRIVAKLEELLLLIDQYAEEEEKLSAITAQFPDAMRKSILQEAVSGKLVPQIASEGTADELLKQIEAERAALIKAGKIKKEKPLPEITEDEVPFEIPKSWKWVRLGKIVYNSGQKIPNKRFSYIDIGSIDNKHQKLNAEEQLIDPKDAPSRARKIVSFGDIIYATVRPYLHNTCIIDKSFTEEPIASTGFAVLTCNSGVYNRYLFSYLLSPEFDNYANSTDNAKGMAYPAINDDALYKGLIPLPPLSEQKRIVAKVEELMQIVDKMN